jgi:DNA repair protein RecO (recombination protein O)
MQWNDEGIVLGVRKHGEANAILELMTREHGRHLGLVRGGAGSRLRPVLQPGNTISAVWRARLDDHLGYFTVEGLQLRAAAFLGAHAVYGVTHLAALVRFLPERDPHPIVHEALEAVLEHLGDAGVVAPLVVRFELLMLAELGFGLDLDSCAATGSTANLVYVSPKSGRAVSRGAGEAWRDRLLPLPAFLGSEEMHVSAEDLDAGFRLTGYFLGHTVTEPRGVDMPPAREKFIAAVMRELSVHAG